MSFAFNAVISPRKRVDTKTDWLTDREMQSDLDFDF
jgi:hypothetical protein